jgi:hypothetical protein
VTREEIEAGPEMNGRNNSELEALPMFKKNLLERKIGLFVISAICYKYADKAISYLLQQPAGNGQSSRSIVV